jgi:gamma-glutamylcyclotransferase (GGCT)/AIG2-like uncharacterized protein YtfP
MTHKVFVYGTLKSGHGNNRLLRESQMLGRCVLHLPYTFVHLGGFPGLVRTNPTPAPRPVGGEVWEVDERTLARLDMLEGHPSFYERLTIETPFGTAWTYTLPPGYGRGQLEEVESPFWRQDEEESAYLSSVSS